MSYPKNRPSPDDPSYPHGERGYYWGHRCDVCKAGHRDKVREDRRKRAAAEPKRRAGVAGEMERTVRRELKGASNNQPPWVETLNLMAITLAIQIDNAAADETSKPQLLPALTAKLLVVLDRIKAAPMSKPGGMSGGGVGDEAEDFVNGLTKFDTP
jgi:hypothetical protein